MFSQSGSIARSGVMLALTSRNVWRIRGTSRGCDPGSRVEIALTFDLPDEVKSQLKEPFVRARYECGLDLARELRFSAETLFLCKADKTATNSQHAPLFPSATPSPPHIVKLPTSRRRQDGRRSSSRIRSLETTPFQQKPVAGTIRSGWGLIVLPSQTCQPMKRVFRPR